MTIDEILDFSRPFFEAETRYTLYSIERDPEYPSRLQLLLVSHDNGELLVSMESPGEHPTIDLLDSIPRIVRAIRANESYAANVNKGK